MNFYLQVNSYDGYHRTALHHAVEHSADCVHLLLAAGANTETIDINRNTPLHWAAFRNRADCCRLLLQYQARVDTVDFNNDTPLNWAAMKGNYASVQVLLEYNASPDVRNYRCVSHFCVVNATYSHVDCSRASSFFLCAFIQINMQSAANTCKLIHIVIFKASKRLI